MAQYKDIDKILNKLPDDLPYKASVKRVLIQAPTEDVVPRAEVKRLVGEYYDKCDECRIKCANAVAREIFEDIDLNLEDYIRGDIRGNAMVARLYSLKKKYTEVTK